MSIYKSNVSSKEAWQKLQNNADAVLIDVRTQAEWFFVGVPDLSALRKDCIFIEWQIFPNMYINGEFYNEFDSYKIKPEQEIFFLCRSGSRSADAANHISNHGYHYCHNIIDGFEGDPNATRHRSSINGWRFHNLPWMQG